jgi:Family of unknown function (DUF6000)
MRFPRADDVELITTIHRYVTAGEGDVKRYIQLLGGNFMRMGEPERAVFLHDLLNAAHEITDKELGVLLESEWRSRLTAAWLIGVDRREHFRDQLAELLLASELVFSGEGYCVALARFGTGKDAGILAAYLDRYLARPECVYNQDWALGALLHIDRTHGTDHAEMYLAPGGPWEQWTRAVKATIPRPANVGILYSTIESAHMSIPEQLPTLGPTLDG